MRSFKKSKFITQRPITSARFYETENSNCSTKRKSKIPRLPKKTYSLEGKYSQLSNRHPTKNEASTTSMIPRLEWNKGRKNASKPNTAPVRERTPVLSRNLNKVGSSDDGLIPTRDQPPMEESSSELSDSCLEGRINENFVNFKKNVLKVPKFWTDAGHTVNSVLKNTIDIVSKQYPTADVEAIETEIGNILKATETVKHQILAKTENIINQANKIYVDRSDNEGEPSEEEVQKLTEKMEELKHEIHLNKKNQPKEVENEFVESRESKKKVKKEVQMEMKKKNEEGKIPKRMELKKSKMVMQSSPREMKKKENEAQSCGDVLIQDARSTTDDDIPDKNIEPRLEDKFTQTINIWTAELHRRDKVLTTLNEQILELHQLCNEQISKFKSFNLQIKLRGICNKAHQSSVSKEVQMLNEEKMQLVETNTKLQYYTKDLETAVKKKNLDLHHKEKVIDQQKRLLHVRDELIEMLKARCNIPGEKL